MKVGQTWQHVERGFQYTIIGVCDTLIWDKTDNQPAYYFAWQGVGEWADGPMFCISGIRPEDNQTDKIVFSLDVTMQISKTYSKPSLTFVVYHDGQGKFWARPEYEFMDGRFVRIKGE